MKCSEERKEKELNGKWMNERIKFKEQYLHRV
jgi:hypothetical protein